MHVGLLIYGDINSQSGGYLYDRQLVSYLQRQGDRVDIISIIQGGYAGDLISRGIPEEISCDQLDILIQDELVYPRVFKINAALKSRLNCPIVSLVHLLDSSRPQLWLRRLLAQWAERRYLNSADGLILNSRNTHQKICELLAGDIPPHIIAVPAADHLLPPVPERVADIPANKSSGLNILYGGNVISQKGLHVLLEALESLDRGCFKLTIAGRLDMEPAYVKQIRRQITRSHPGQSIHFTGALNGTELTACYLKNDILVLPSVNEAYGIVYIEAQGFGLPVIGTIAGGAAEIIKHGWNGYLMEPGDSKALSELLILLNNDRDLLKHMGSNARNYYRQHPTWDDSCGKIRDFLINTIQVRDRQS
ncbi:MAG: glycosyltransferase family 4 protein [Desulfuromusa sp.]|nr:glycosyltransferase family 4 protein [Desulfuromusa sp.]